MTRTDSGTVSERPPAAPGSTSFSGLARWGVIALAAATVLFVSPPVGITPQAWRLLAVFVATILGLILHPLPVGAMVLLGVAAAAVSGALSPVQALAGYADPLVWMVFAAFCMARGMITTGLGRRIALLFIRRFGGTSLGLGYSVVASDVVLGTVIPSNGARAGGIIFPVVKSLAEAYDSRPGPTAGRLGTFMMLMVYHCDVTVAALWLTGQSSNPLIASLAKQVTGIEIGYGRWALGALAPALVSLVIVPLLLYRLMPPSVRSTPEAPQMARAELAQHGPMSHAERLMLAVFCLLVCLFLTKPWHGVDYPVVALLGLGVLLVGRVLSWEDVLNERAAWDVFVWFGGIYQMARALGDAGVMKVFAQAAAGLTAGTVWWGALAALLIVYVYAHYMFATMTAHVSAMYIPFLLVTIAAGTPPALAALSLAYLSCLGASLTHYGTTTSPIYFGAGYLTQNSWWRVGLWVTTVNTLVWVVVGAAWWKILGWW